MYADNLSLFFSFLSLRLCLYLRRPGLHVRRTWRKHKQKEMEIGRTCKPGFNFAA